MHCSVHSIVYEITTIRCHCLVNADAVVLYHLTCTSEKYFSIWAQITQKIQLTVHGPQHFNKI